MFARSPLYQLSNRDSKKGLITATTFFYTAVNIPALPETGLSSPRNLISQHTIFLLTSSGLGLKLTVSTIGTYLRIIKYHTLAN